MKKLASMICLSCVLAVSCFMFTACGEMTITKAEAQQQALNNLKQFREDYVITEAEKNACEEYTSDNDFNIYINDDYIEQTNEIKEFQLDLK